MNLSNGKLDDKGPESFTIEDLIDFYESRAKKGNDRREGKLVMTIGDKERQRIYKVSIEEESVDNLIHHLN